jgi:hypothetical protein
MLDKNEAAAATPEFKSKVSRVPLLVRKWESVSSLFTSIRCPVLDSLGQRSFDERRIECSKSVKGGGVLIVSRRGENRNRDDDRDRNPKSEGVDEGSRRKEGSERSSAGVEMEDSCDRAQA